MSKEKIIYDLAMIYAQERFHDSLKELSPEQKLNYDDLSNLLYCYFEDAYITFNLMPERRFDFSDITANN